MSLRASVERQRDTIKLLRKQIIKRNSATPEEQKMLLDSCAGDEKCITALYLWLMAEAGVAPKDVIRGIKLTSDGQPRPGAVLAAQKRHALLGLQAVSAH